MHSSIAVLQWERKKENRQLLEIPVWPCLCAGYLNFVEFRALLCRSPKVRATAAKPEQNADCWLGCDTGINSGSQNTTLFCPRDTFVVSMTMFAPQDHCLDVGDWNTAGALQPLTSGLTLSCNPMNYWNCSGWTTRLQLNTTTCIHATFKAMLTTVHSFAMTWRKDHV